MSRPYPLVALALGLVGFAAIEVAGGLVGVRTALGPSLLLDAAAYGVGTLLVALAVRRPLARARGARAALPLLAHLLALPFAIALLAGAADLTAIGGWGSESLLRGAFIAGPLNLILTFTLELWYVALPLAIASLWALRRAARPAGARGGW